MYRYGVLFLVLVGGIGMAHEKGEPTTQNEIIRGLAPSFITIGAGLNFGDGHGKPTDQLFEARVNNHLNMDEGRVFGLNYMLRLNPRVELRMLAEDSNPVKTPGFLPRLTAFLWADTSFAPKQRRFYASAMLSHHSNGQSGEFFGSDCLPDTNSASFSTNFFQFSVYSLNLGSVFPAWLQASVIWHPGFNRSDGLTGIYEDVKLQLNFRTQVYNLFGSSEWQIKANGALGYTLSGRDWKVDTHEGEVVYQNGKAIYVETETQDLFQASLQATLNFPGLDQLHLYARYDYGWDYYNIRFWQRLNRLQIGFAGDPFFDY